MGYIWLAMKFPFNEKKAAQAAAHLLKLNGGKMDKLVLIKLLYIADRRTLIEHGQPITGDKMLSLDNGPALSQVLNLINERHAPRRSAWVDYVGALTGDDVPLKAAKPATDQLSRYELRILRETFDTHGKLDPEGKPWDLVKWCHDNIPEWENPHGGSVSIEYADVLRKARVSEADIERIQKDADLLCALDSLGR
jgi:uncharacterized phage-associated protein